MQARVQAIEKVERKLHAYIRTIENRHQSGVSNEDILSIKIYDSFNFKNSYFDMKLIAYNDLQMQQAKVLFMQDLQYKSGWKYDHVWDFIKNF